MCLWLSENLCRSTLELDYYGSEFETSVSGCYDNTVYGIDSSMIGGNRNKALRRGFICFIIWDYTNTVSGYSSSVCVDIGNIEGGDYSSDQWMLK